MVKENESHGYAINILFLLAQHQAKLSDVPPSQSLNVLNASVVEAFYKKNMTIGDELLVIRLKKRLNKTPRRRSYKGRSETKGPMKKKLQLDESNSDEDREYVFLKQVFATPKKSADA